MFRSQRPCSELLDPAAWSREAPLPPPTWVRDIVPAVARVVEAAAELRTADARAVLSQIDGERLRLWGLQQAQMAGICRHRALEMPAGGVSLQGGGPRHPTPERTHAVFARDRYHCRYCGIAVIPTEVFGALHQALGRDVFPMGRAFDDRHGAALLLCAQVDHVVPYFAGGNTTDENLVTACWSCDAGKDEFTLAQIGLDDPRTRPPSDVAWDGLVSLLRGLKGEPAEVEAR